MKYEDKIGWCIIFYFLTLCILGISILYAVSYKSKLEELKSQAVENNYAQYNSKTAKFEWIKNNN